MKKLTFFSALVICCLSLSCSKEVPPGGDIPSPAPPALYPGFTVSNEFGLKMYETIYRENPDSNLCISPFSIRTCLSLVANGAAGEDQAEILKALNLTGTDLESLNEDYRQLTKYLVQADPAVTYEAANSFWYQNGTDVMPDFRSDMTEYYNADVYPVDFRWSGTLKLMNDWVNLKTHGKITEIADYLPPNTVMNLTNAIYFNGEWTHKFNPKETKPWAFQKPDRTTSRIAVMTNIQKYRFYEHPSWYGLEMTYGKGDWAMYVFMPHQAGSLDKLTSWLTINWENIRKEFVSDKAILIRFPQFRIENNFKLVPFLRERGINRVLNPGANFSRMMKQSLYISEVIHKTYIKVNEDGTEAAAITSAWGIMGSPPGLFFDHPFTYIIAERSTGLILFIGQVTDPK